VETVAPTHEHELFFGLTYQYAPIFMSIVVVALLVLVAWVGTRNLKMVPGRGQALLEMIVSAFRDLVTSTMGPKDGRTYLPLVGTIFLYVFLSNMIGLVPTGEVTHKLTGHTDFYIAIGGYTLTIPGFMEPTRNVNTPWGLGIMVFFIMHVAAIVRKGPGKYFDEYFTPHFGGVTWPMQKPVMRTLAAAILAAIWAALTALVVALVGLQDMAFWAWTAGVGLLAFVWCMVRLSHEPRKVGVPNLLMFPLNVIGKLAEILSMSFRLFGNIFGGAVIIALLGGMVHQLALPILLQAFMGIFVGTIQAFVFAMLAMTYITVEIAEDEVEEAIEHRQDGADAEAETAA
jgi:F0F1-type ATP synthase membrane subunit a